MACSTYTGHTVTLEADEIAALIHAAEKCPWMQNTALDTALAKLRGVQTLLITQAVKQAMNARK